jgi:hypothetical protein
MARRKAALARTHRKVSLTLSAEADEKLTIQARRGRTTRSELASELLSNALRQIVVSIRGQAGENETEGGIAPALSVRIG